MSEKCFVFSTDSTNPRESVLLAGLTHTVLLCLQGRTCGIGGFFLNRWELWRKTNCATVQMFDLVANEAFATEMQQGSECAMQQLKDI